MGFRANLKGNILSLLIGFSHDVSYKIPDGIKLWKIAIRFREMGEVDRILNADPSLSKGSTKYNIKTNFHSDYFFLKLIFKETPLNPNS